VELLLPYEGIGDDCDSFEYQGEHSVRYTKVSSRVAIKFVSEILFSWYELEREMFILQ